MSIDLSLIATIIDNSAYPSAKPQLQEGKEGWYRYLSDQASPGVELLGIQHLLIRQPFPTPLGGRLIKQDILPGADSDVGWRRVPMWATGYRQAQLDDNDVLWQTFKPGIKKWRRKHPQVKITCYSGHLGGDPAPIEGEPVRNNYWAEDAILRVARLKGPNSFRHELDRIFTQYDAIKADVMLDASGRIAPSSPYFQVLDFFRRLTQDDGRDFGVESPAKPGTPLFELGLNGGAVWGVRRGFINAGMWDKVPGPRIIFIMSQTNVQPIRGDIGGWSRPFHEMIAKRVRECQTTGDVAVLNTNAITRGGFISIEEWLNEFAPLDTEPDPPVIADPPNLQGDTNGDGFIGLDDLTMVLEHWGQDVEPGTNGDTTGDGFVGIEDLDSVLLNWNKGTKLVAEELNTLLQNK